MVRSAGAERHEALRVFAAGSLRRAFDGLAAAQPGALALTYANARDLAARIEAGDPADVFASASPEHPLRLHAAGLVDAPVAFATNRVVVAVSAGSEATGVEVLAARGTRLVIEVAGIPLGDYTRELLARLGDDVAARALANVVAQEQLVDDVAARLLAGEADAGVLYATDVAARAPRLRAIEVPREAAVAATYVACAARRTAHAERAAAWIAALKAAPARRVLHGAGFGPAP